jgi:phosphoglycerate dehydrogenase-like enzyme
MRLALPAAVRDHLPRMPPGHDVAWYADFEECRAAAAGAEVLWLDFFRRPQVESVLQHADRLRWVFTRGAGMDRQPLELYRERGVVLTNGSGLAAGPIAESLVLAMLAAAKRFPDLVRAQDRAEWLPRPPGLGELQDTRALVLGYGEIGRAVGARLAGFGVEVVGVRRQPAEEPAVIGPDEWRRRLPEFDWVLVTVASIAANRHLVGAPELAAMKAGAWILNVTRGWVVDQAALLEALRAGRIGGAYLDVTDPEPLPAESELWRLPNVIITPHSSWASGRFAERAAELFLDNLGRYLEGAPLRNVVDLRAGY